MKEEKLRKKMEKKKMVMEEEELGKTAVTVVKELKAQMDMEYQLAREKRQQEKDYLKKMLDENDRYKYQQQMEKERERLADVKAQEEYTKMLDK